MRNPGAGARRGGDPVESARAEVGATGRNVRLGSSVRLGGTVANRNREMGVARSALSHLYNYTMGRFSDFVHGGDHFSLDKRFLASRVG